MKRQWRQPADHYSLYNDATEPMLSTITTPMPRIFLLRESWLHRVFRSLGTFFSVIINKVNQLLALALAVLLLLLFTRFTLSFFHFSISGGPFSFSYWIFFLSTPLVVPFQNMLPALPYYGNSIEVTTLIAILVYTMGITVIRQFLKVFVTR